ncbi:glutamate-binding protein [Pseudolysinimonas yzui]|uniref:Glutamate-binding protein n=2 Tax=Pseudolysinimonas yzui TaxID=2708254 RepID=A0A8J3LZQ1_9MICO|nr:glutamate-binding protein [Pseudolysinimonas yzui]
MAMEGTMRVRTAMSLGALAVAGALVLSGCVDSSAPGGEATEPTEEFTPVPYEEGTTMAALADAGEITIGTKYAQPLFGLEGPDGIPVGFDVEIGKIIAMHLGIDEESINWVNTVSANREPFIQSGEVDIVIATYTINDTRKEVISFAGPYYEAGQDILVAAGNPEGIDGPEWFADNPDATVCTVSGSTSLTNIQEYTTNVLEAADYADCLEPIRTGEAVAVTTDNVILAGLADQNAGEFEVVNNPFTAEPYGIGLPKDDTEFRMWLNDVLEASYEDGSWAAAWEATAGAVLDLPEPPAVDRY